LSVAAGACLACQRLAVILPAALSAPILDLIVLGHRRLHPWVNRDACRRLLPAAPLRRLNAEAVALRER